MHLSTTQTVFLVALFAGALFGAYPYLNDVETKHDVDLAEHLESDVVADKVTTLSNP